MHQLTIDTTAVTVTEHDSPDEARAALLAYAVDGDYYLRALPGENPHTRYQLLTLDEASPGQRSHQPRIAGTASIATLSETGLVATGPYFAACEAQRWITGASRNRDTLKLSNPYPDAVLTLAQGAASGSMNHELLARESAALADGGATVIHDAATLEALRHNAITTATANLNPAQLAAAVQQQLPAGTSDAAAATLVWYYALCLWGAHT